MALSPRLRAMVEDAGFSEALSDANLRSCIIIANVWDEESEAIEGLTGLGCPELFAISLWSQCSEICNGVVGAIEKHGLPPGNLQAPPSVSPPVASSLASVARAASTAQVKCVSKKATSKLTATVAALWDILILAGTHSQIAATAATLSQSLQAKLRAHILARWVDLPLSSLRLYLSIFNSFSAWCNVNFVNTFEAAPTHFTLYLADLQEKKATVAQNHYRALCWLRKHLELDWRLDTTSFAQAAYVRASHVESQVSPMRITLWALLSLLSGSQNCFVKGVALFWMIIIGAVMRPAHLQRSKLTDLGADFLEGTAFAGKARIFGKRRPFKWRSARQDILNSDMGSRAWDFFLESGPADRMFFLPDTVPPGNILMAKSWSNSPMSQSKIRGLTNGILERLGVSAEAAGQLRGFYAGRRLLPTLAHKFRFTAGERLDVGGWAGGSDLKMPQRYSEARLDEQGKVRLELTRLSSNALHRIMAKHPAPTREEEVLFSLSRQWKSFACRSTLGTPANVAEVQQWLQGICPNLCKLSLELTEPPSPTTDEGNYSSGSSSSNSSKKDTSIDCIMEVPGKDVQWELSGGRNGHLHLVVNGMLSCGRTLSRPQEGTGLEEAHRTGHIWSPRCKANLLEEDLEWLHKAEHPE